MLREHSLRRQKAGLSALCQFMRCAANGRYTAAEGESPLGIRYRKAISAALAAELGGAGRAAKDTMMWTGASERTAKNWISGTYGPAAEHLIELMRHSDTVLAVVLELAGRNEAMNSIRLGLVRNELSDILRSLNAICDRDED